MGKRNGKRAAPTRPALLFRSRTNHRPPREAALPLTLRLGTDDLGRCRFAVSPLCQTHEALRMLRRSARHGYHRAWLRRAAPAVAGLDLSPLWLFIPPVGGYTPDFLGPPPEEPYPR
ncbi:ArsR family transcriptional regulator, partial [Streptomyces sviceus ATCC 29083]